MDKSGRQSQVAAALSRINEAWLKGTPDAIGDFVADDIVMVLPAFSGSVMGREAFVSGFRDFCDNTRIYFHSETDYQVDVIGNTAIASFRFEMVYERDGNRYRSTGRDFWVFEEQASRWSAVWRTMFDLIEEPVKRFESPK